MCLECAQSALVWLTAQSLSCTEAPFAEGAADEVRWARGAYGAGPDERPGASFSGKLAGDA